MTELLEENLTLMALTSLDFNFGNNLGVPDDEGSL